MTASEYLSEFTGVNIITKSSLSVKAEITWNVLNGDVIYIVDPSTLARRLPIKNVINPLISEQINAHYTFSFDTVFDDKTKYINNANIIEVDDDYFQVGRIVKKRETSVTMSVSCEHVSYKLLDKKKYPLPFTEAEDSPRNLMSVLLSGTPFSVGTVEIGGSYYIKPKSDNIRGALIELANLVGGELIWEKFTVHLVKRRGADNGLEFKLGENLIGVTEEIDTTGEEPKVSLGVDVLDLAQSGIEGYENLAKVEIGDTVRSYDPLLEIDRRLRIIARDYNPFQRINPFVQIGNVVRDITTYIRDKLKGEKETDPETPNANYWLSEFRFGDINCLNLDGVLLKNNATKDDIVAEIEYVKPDSYLGLFLNLKEEYADYTITVTLYHPDFFPDGYSFNWDEIKDIIAEQWFPSGMEAILITISNQNNEKQVYGIKFVQNIPQIFKAKFLSSESEGGFRVEILDENLDRTDILVNVPHILELPYKIEYGNTVLVVDNVIVGRFPITKT
ncbi:prophage endopeptidase tail family protein [Aeribacillus sp. FSL K6-2848]|uniref:prophage endopeptidase tail family protein n=1 Tax=Aeribacillus sp. FSL K6-2848 TaxID=2954612 RepID=UPI0030FAB1A1